MLKTLDKAWWYICVILTDESASDLLGEQPYISCQQEAYKRSILSYEPVVTAYAIRASTKELVLRAEGNYFCPLWAFSKEGAYDFTPVLLRCSNTTSTPARMVSTKTAIPRAIEIQGWVKTNLRLRDTQSKKTAHGIFGRLLIRCGLEADDEINSCSRRSRTSHQTYIFDEMTTNHETNQYDNGTWQLEFVSAYEPTHKPNPATWQIICVFDS